MCSKMNIISATKSQNQLENGLFEGWHNIGKDTDVKKTITFKTITVAIGVLVAVMIALTLWIRTPEEASLTRFPSRPQATVLAPAKKMINTAVDILSSLHYSSKN